MSTLNRWIDSFSIYQHPRVLVMLFFGFAAGLPFLLVFSTLSAWLRDVGVDRTTIGYFSWVGLLFSLKVFWSPVIDRYGLPLLGAWMGQRRSWLLVAQLGIVTALLGLALTDPAAQLERVAWLAIAIAWCSATQDICIDAYRIESASEDKQAAMAALYILGYRLAMLVAGAGTFYLADGFSWSLAYAVMAAAMGVGIICTLVVAEPTPAPQDETVAHERELQQWATRVPHIPWLWPRQRTEWVLGAVVAPFVEFFRRLGWFACLILLFISVFRLSDLAMGVMANPFYLDMGYTKSEIASVAKVFGFFMTIAGSLLGGVLVNRYGLFGPLLLGAVGVAATNLLFAWMAGQPPELSALALVLSADNLAAGLSNVVFIAYLSSLTNRHYTATQYALFSSLMTLPGKFIGGFSGWLVDHYGYAEFFLYAAGLGLPAVTIALYLLWRERAAPSVAVEADRV